MQQICDYILTRPVAELRALKIALSIGGIVCLAASIGLSMLMMCWEGLIPDPSFSRWGRAAQWGLWLFLTCVGLLLPVVAFVSLGGIDFALLLCERPPSVTDAEHQALRSLVRKRSAYASVGCLMMMYLLFFYAVYSDIRSVVAWRRERDSLSDEPLIPPAA